MVSEAGTPFIFILVIRKRTKLKNFMSEPYERTLFFFIYVAKTFSNDLCLPSQIAGAARASSMPAFY
jgi:hypothetical protein